MLKDNKQMLLGVVVGLVLCKYFKGDLVEGYWTNVYAEDGTESCEGQDYPEGSTRPDFGPYGLHQRNRPAGESSIGSFRTKEECVARLSASTTHNRRKGK